MVKPNDKQSVQFTVVRNPEKQCINTWQLILKIYGALHTIVAFFPPFSQQNVGMNCILLYAIQHESTQPKVNRIQVYNKISTIPLPFFITGIDWYC